MPSLRSDPIGDVVRLWPVSRQFSVEEVLCYVNCHLLGDLTDSIEVGVNCSLGHFFFRELRRNTLQFNGEKMKKAGKRINLSSNQEGSIVDCRRAGENASKRDAWENVDVVSLPRNKLLPIHCHRIHWRSTGKNTLT